MATYEEQMNYILDTFGGGNVDFAKFHFTMKKFQREKEDGSANADVLEILEIVTKFAKLVKVIANAPT